MGFVLLFLWKENRLNDIGTKIIWIPLLIITISILIRSTFSLYNPPAYNTQFEIVAEILMALVLFGCYLIGRVLGKEIFHALIPFVILQSIIAIIYPIFIEQGESNGGLISKTNYDLATGFIMVGTFLVIWKWQWLLIPLAFTGMIFLGSGEALVAMIIMIAVFIYRSDISIKILPTLIIPIIAISLWLTVGYGDTQYERIENQTKDFFTFEEFMPASESEGLEGIELTGIDNEKSNYLETWGSGRKPSYERAINNITPIGHDYELYKRENTTGQATVHNVPLVIVDQIGPLAALAWFFVTLYCLVRTKFKYAFVAILSVCIFDHYIWTTMAPYWWVAVGVATASSIKSDLIFKKGEENAIQNN